jgi:hypothetical protein
MLPMLGTARNDPQQLSFGTQACSSLSKDLCKGYDMFMSCENLCHFNVRKYKFFNIIITIVIWPHNIYQQSNVYSISWKEDRVVWIGVKYLLSHDFPRSKVDHDDHPFCQYQSQNRPLAFNSLHFRDHRRKQILLIPSKNVHEFVRVN